MGWYPCGCCGCVERVLFWLSDFGDYSGYNELRQIYVDMGALVHDDRDWTGTLSDYQLVIWDLPQFDPPWWSQITGNTWHGRIVFMCEHDTLTGVNGADSVYVNSKSGITGINVQSVTFFGPGVGTVEPHALTAGVLAIKYHSYTTVSGGTILSRNNDETQTWLSYNRPAGSRASFVVSGDSSMATDSAGFADDNIVFLQNLWTVGKPPCGTTPMVLPLNAPPIRFAFATASLLGTAAATNTVNAATTQAITFTLSGNLADANAGQINAATTVVFGTSAVALATGRLIGTTPVTFSTQGTALATGALSGNTSLTFSTSALATGAGRMTGTSTLTFTATLTPSTSGMTSLTFSTTGQLRGAAPAAGSTNLSFAPTGAIRGSGAMSGTCNFGFSTSGALRGAVNTSGSTSLTFSTAAALGAPAEASGTTTITFATAGQIKGAGRLIGASALTFTTLAALRGAGRAIGDTSLTFTNSGQGTLAASLAGVTSLTFATAGSLKGSGQLIGASSVTFATAGAMLATGRMTGATTLTFTPSAAGVATGQMTGTTSVVFTTAGSVLASGRLAGSLIVHIDEGHGASLPRLTGSVQLVGVTTLGFVPTGLMQGSRQIAGTTTITFSTGGQLKGVGRLFSIASTITFSTSGVLTGTGLACSYCTANAQNTYTVNFINVEEGDCGPDCEGWNNNNFVLTRDDSECVNACCWHYVSSVPCEFNEIRLIIDNLGQVILQVEDSSQFASAQWVWDAGGAPIANCSGSNISANLVYQGDVGAADCVWTNVVPTVS